MQFHQRIDRRLIDLRLVGRPLIQIFAHPDFAEILKQHQPAGRVFSQDARRAQAIGIKPLGRPQERRGILGRRRRIHQHRALLAQAKAEIAAERSIARQRFDHRITPAGSGQKCFESLGKFHVHPGRPSQFAPGSTIAVRSVSAVSMVIERQPGS